jgi:hypothetical protein
MRIVWVLTILHLVGGAGVEANSMPTLQAHETVPSDPRYEQVTIGFYASRSACIRMRAQVLQAPGFKAGSARCHKELN